MRLGALVHVSLAQVGLPKAMAVPDPNPKTANETKDRHKND